MSGKLSKRQFRIEVFKGVFLSEFYNDDEIEEQLDDLFNQDVHYEEISVNDKDALKISDKCKAILDNVSDIDSAIADNLDKWTIGRIGKVELAILRIAVYEMQYDKLDAAIAINEAVEIAKIYGGDKSGAFVNGVLAKLV